MGTFFAAAGAVRCTWMNHRRNAECRTRDTMTERLRPPAFCFSSAITTRSISSCKAIPRRSDGQGFLHVTGPPRTSLTGIRTTQQGRLEPMSDAQYIPPPPPPAPPSASGPPQFDFGKPFTYVFDDPRWLQKILIGGLFYLASFLLVGWFFILGYLARVVRNIIADVTLPLPEWEDLGGFFNEGVRLFGISLIYCLPA